MTLNSKAFHIEVVISMSFTHAIWYICTIKIHFPYGFFRKGRNPKGVNNMLRLKLRLGQARRAFTRSAKLFGNNVAI